MSCGSLKAFGFGRGFGRDWGATAERMSLLIGDYFVEGIKGLCGAYESMTGHEGLWLLLTFTCLELL